MGRSFFLMVVIFSSVGAISTIAQTFPVRVTPILTPPYTPFLTDYTDAGAERLTVQIILNDLTVSEFRTKLRLTIEGVGITITTNPNYVPLPITLQGGVPQLIYGSDMADYFRLSNLVFQGLSPGEVEKNGGRLPEGIYRISIEVLDYNRNTVVSNKGSATAWMILNDPPFINLPVNNVRIKPLNPQNVVFQWTPRHRGSPNAAFTTEYEVKLVEIWPAGRNPFDAINTSRPIFETTTESTMVVYGPAETPLVLGREYALQVRARDSGGRDVFKNDGYSEVVRFIYGDECPVPTSLEADDISTAKARMKWQGNGQNSAYLIKLREQKEGARWFSERTEQSYYNSTNLRAGTTYEYQLAGECDIYQSKESEIRTFNTLAENPNAFVCADPNAVPPPDGSPPLRELFTNDFIHAGGFDVVVNQATGSNGRFSGEGLAIVPWFNSAKVRVIFKDISVNSSYQLTAGMIESVWNANSKFLVESEKTLAEGGGRGLQSELVLSEADTLISIPGVILTITVHPETKDITVETRDGQVLIPTGGQGKTVAITDEAGNGYLVDKDGKVTKTTTTEAQLARARGEREYSTDENLKVDFLKAADTKYGLDLPQTVLAQNYQQTENGEYVAWKALEAGKPDNVAVAARGTGDVTQAKFKTALDDQILMSKAQGAETVQLAVTGKTDGMVDELLAFYPNPDTTKAELVAGKLNMISYDIEKKGLVLVSVNGTEAKNIGNLQQRLNEIYSQGVVEWISVGQEDLSVSGIDEKNIDDGGSGVLSNYTDDMKKILRAYTAYHTLADNTYYLFLVKNSISKSKLGYMPRKRQAGFIFVDAHNGQDMVLTMAHELGHGAFHLKHTFSEYSLSQGVTENLMDYPAKTRLDKWQWDKIHNPEAVLGLFEDDDEGALYSNAKMVKFLSSLRANNDNYAKNPDPGERAYLKENVVSEQDLKDQKVIDYFSDLSLYKFNPDYTASDPVIQGWLSLFNTSKDSEWKKLIENKANPVPYDQNPILLAREMEVETNTKEKFKLSMNGYSLSTKSITLYAHETKVGDDTKLTFFNGLIAPSGETNPNDEKNVINIRKSFDITVHSKNVQAFKDYIKLRGTIAPIDENPDSEEIIIDVVRKRSNNYITVSELSIRGTNIKGAALELGKGTEAESKASCTEYKADCYECKRVPAGEFAFDINTETTKQGQHKYKTIRLLKTDTHGSKRSGILIHMGDALSWTQGCLLAMYDNEIETIIQDDANIVSRIMGYGINIDVMNAGRAFILSMIEFIEEKEKRLGKSVTKKVIIKDDAQEKTLSINTSTFDLLQKANRYYYTEKLYDKAVKHFETFVTVLQQKAIHDRLNTELSEYTATLLPGLSKETFKESEIKELFGMKWGELLATHANYISLSDLMNSAILAQSDFSESLRASFAVFIKDQDVMNYLFHKTLKTSLHDNVTGFFEDRDGGKKKGFVSQNYTQELFDKILIESKVKLINQEIDKIVKAIEK